MALPLKLPLDLMQTKWKSEIDPVLANAMTNMSILKDVKLVSGTNVINHLLGKTQQGWLLVDINSAATVYRSAPFNNLTLSLNSSAPVTISLGVF